MACASIRQQCVGGVIEGYCKQAIFRGQKFKVDDPLRLFSAGDRRRLRSTRCEQVCRIQISSSTVVILDNSYFPNDEEKQKLARDVGFNNFTALMRSLKEDRCLPFDGQLVTWL